MTVRGIWGHAPVVRAEVLDRAAPTTVYRFRTRRGCCELVFGPMSWLRQDRGLCPFACST